MSDARLFVEAALDAAAQARPVRLAPLDGEALASLAAFAVAQKLESVLASAVPALAGLGRFLAALDAVQRRAFAPDAAALAGIESLVLVQGFPWNARLGPALPPGPRGDIDVYVAPRDVARYEETLARLGYRALGIDAEGRVVELDEAARREAAAQASGGHVVKDPALSRMAEEPPPPLEDALELADAYGPIRRLAEGPRVFLVLERTSSYGGADEGDLITDPANQERFLGARTLDATTFATFSARRVHVGVREGQERLRSLMELAAILGDDRHGFEAPRFVAQARRCGFLEDVRAVLGSLAQLSGACAARIASLELPHALDREFHEALLHGQGLVEGAP